MKGMADLLWLKITNNSIDTGQNLFDEWHHFSDLDLNEMAPTLLRDFDERIAGHVLNAVVSLCHRKRQLLKWILRYNGLMQTVHEFEELIDHSLQELPVSSEKAGILSDDIHNIGCDNCFVVFPSLLLT